MGRPVQPQLRQQLLEASTDYALVHGLPERLEELAAGTGTSSRVLLYHFGTRDDLLRAVLGRARERQREAWGRLFRGVPGRPYLDVLAEAWQVMTGPEGQPYLRMFGQLRQDAEQRLWPGFRRDATTDWLGPLAEGLGRLGRPELATLVLAVIRGLVLDLEATGDHRRADTAFGQFLDALAADASTSTVEPCPSSP